MGGQQRRKAHQRGGCPYSGDQGYTTARGRIDYLRAHGLPDTADITQRYLIHLYSILSTFTTRYNRSPSIAPLSSHFNYFVYDR